MSSELIVSPIELRPERYDFLFAELLPYEIGAQPEVLGVAALSRAITRGGRTPREHGEHKRQIPNIVAGIITAHEAAARDPKGSQEAIFGFASQKAQESVADIVTRVFSLWEICQKKRKQKYLLDGTPTAHWLVIETAAAVMDCMAPGSGINIIDNKKDRATLTRLVAFRGPAFARRWFDGTIFTEWATDEGLPPHEYIEWQTLLTPSMYKDVLHDNINAPLDTLKAIRHNLNTHLTDESLADYFGWTTREVQEFFTPGTRKMIARGYIKDPFTALYLIRDALENCLTDEIIAEHAGSHPYIVRAMLPSSTRKYLAIRNSGDPLGAAVRMIHNLTSTLTTSNIAARTGRSDSFVRQVFTEGILAMFAKDYPTDPLSAAQAWLNDEVSLSSSRDLYMRRLRAEHDKRLENLE